MLSVPLNNIVFFFALHEVEVHTIEKQSEEIRRTERKELTCLPTSCTPQQQYRSCIAAEHCERGNNQDAMIITRSTWNTKDDAPEATFQAVVGAKAVSVGGLHVEPGRSRLGGSL